MLLFLGLFMGPGLTPLTWCISLALLVQLVTRCNYSSKCKLENAVYCDLETTCCHVLWTRTETFKLKKVGNLNVKGCGNW